MPFVTAAGHRIEYVRIDAGGSGRPPLVFLHEGLGSVAMWRDFPARVARATGCDAVVYSRYGYGASDPLSGPRTVEYMHEEALAALPELLDALGIDGPILVGHSDGASIALIHAGASGRRPAALVLLAPHVLVEDLSVASIAAAKVAYETGDLRGKLARYHADVDSAFWGWNRIWLHPDFRRWNIEELLPGIACPVLAIQGKEDEYGTLRQVDRIAAAVRDVERVELADCRHSPHRDQPEAVIEAIAGFVDRCLRREGPLVTSPAIMDAPARPEEPIRFETRPDRYRHWRLDFPPSHGGAVARLVMDVAEDGGRRPPGTPDGYSLKLNSYDLGVDIELADALQRVRFEHPEVRALIVTSLRDRIFCSGANIYMLGRSSHVFKVNFCKYTNETRLYLEEMSAESGIPTLAALNGTASGGGYELAIACDEILLADDGSSVVSLPEVPLLGVLPGTGGLTRLVDKRKVRRDLADAFSTAAEGVRGRRAVEWGLVDEAPPKARFAEAVERRLGEMAARSRRKPFPAVALPPLEPSRSPQGIEYRYVSLSVDAAARTASLEVRAPEGKEPETPAQLAQAGAQAWALRAFRELDDALLELRFNHPAIGVVAVRTAGEKDAVLAVDRMLARHGDDGLVREVVLHMRRVLKRLDLSSKSFFALVEPGSCFAGSLLELALASDRIYMKDTAAERVAVAVSPMNAGPLPMPNGLTRLQSRFLREPGRVSRVLGAEGPLDTRAAVEAGLVTFAPDDIDWDDEVRIAFEERASLSPDALTGTEASLRFGGPETMETKIFGRLSAWQNWIFQRPNAVGERGALTLYGKPERPGFDWRRC